MKKTSEREASYGRLLIDWDSGEGSVHLPKRFLKESALFRADVVKDWLNELAPLYTGSLEEWTAELKEIEKNARRTGR